MFGGSRICAAFLALAIFSGPAIAEFDVVEHDKGPISGSSKREGPAETYPRWLIRLVDPIAEPFGRTAAHLVWRKGQVTSHAEALGYLQANLRPLDILVTKSRGRLTGHLIPGWFSHAVVYLGSESSLRALGAWSDPEVRPHLSSIRSGKVYIEAVSSKVRLTGIAKAIDADQVAVLRPRLPARARRQALREFFAHVGTPYDFRIDAGESDRLYCAELVDHVLKAHLPRHMHYGRQVIWPAEMATAALSGRNGLGFVLYVKADRGNWIVGDRAMLKKDIAEHW